MTRGKACLMTDAGVWTATFQQRNEKGKVCAPPEGEVPRPDLSRTASLSTTKRADWPPLFPAPVASAPSER